MAADTWYFGNDFLHYTTSDVSFHDDTYIYHPDNIREEKDSKPDVQPCPRKLLNPRAFEVRQSVCVVGQQRETLQKVKHKIASLLDVPFPIESLHVKSASDIKDDALLVPKVILVAVHSPGRKLIDEEGDHGQLDLLYDAAIEMGADVMIIYVGLPRSVYPPMRHIVYHPRLNDLVFPTQPLLGQIAEQNELVTLVENSDFGHMQKNVIREWMLRPVTRDHRVFHVAESLSTAEMSDADFWSETEVHQLPTSLEDFLSEGPSSAAVEAPKDTPKKKRRRKLIKFRKRREEAKPKEELISLCEEGEFDTGSVEIELGGSSVEVESFMGFD
ncbi:hypothetical protein NP493_548g02058 [Ridgeia piscesae]|uniref:Uncharacterized protein n=1 Tax=Ridgeia piscesae TaxID=27915 RepID=A0AAD9NRR9_RIDPI|nr:hypothetical protein NP493_548g02058 [Ridgeia piscesae]